MDLITQILAALVIILALALYNRTQSTTTATSPTLSDSSKGSKVDSSNTKRANKKKKKSNSKSIQSPATTAQDSSQSTNTNSSKKETSIQSQPHNDHGSSQNEIPVSKPITENPSSRSSILNSMPSAQEQASTSNKPNGSSSKTNDQRREEINSKKVGKGEERVADMIDRDIQPETTYERVARIPATAPETTSQSNGFGPNDYEEWEQLPVEDQGGWESVGQGSKSSRLQSTLASTSKTNPSSNGVSSYASNNPFSALPDGGDSSWASVGRNGAAKSLKVPSSGNGAVKSLNGSSSSNGGARVAQNVVNSEPTKKQRQNAAKAAAKKAQKEAEEEERLERLAKHKKEVEGERIKEFYSKGSGSKPTPKTSGGPKASVNQNGALVWD